MRLGMHSTTQSFMEIGSWLTSQEMCDFARRIVYYVYSATCLGSSCRPQKRCPRRFWPKIRQKTRLGVTRVCLFGVVKTKFNTQALFCKNDIGTENRVTRKSCRPVANRQIWSRRFQKCNRFLAAGKRRSWHVTWWPVCTNIMIKPVF